MSLIRRHTCCFDAGTCQGCLDELRIHGRTQIQAAARAIERELEAERDGRNWVAANPTIRLTPRTSRRSSVAQLVVSITRKAA